MSNSELNRLTFHKGFRTERISGKALVEMVFLTGVQAPRGQSDREPVADGVRRLSLPVLGDRGHDLSQDAHALGDGVLGALPGGPRQGRCIGPALVRATGLALQERVVNAPRDLTGDGRSKPSLSAQWPDGDGQRLLGGVRVGIRGRGASIKTLVMVMVGSHGENRAGFAVMRTLPRVDRHRVCEGIAEAIQPRHTMRADGLLVYEQLTTFDHAHAGATVSPKQATGELPWVQSVISNAKRFLLGTYYGPRLCCAGT